MIVFTVRARVGRFALRINDFTGSTPLTPMFLLDINLMTRMTEISFMK